VGVRSCVTNIVSPLDFVPLQTEFSKRFHESIPGGGLTEKQIDKLVGLCDTNNGACVVAEGELQLVQLLTLSPLCPDGYCERSDIRSALFALSREINHNGPLTARMRPSKLKFKSMSGQEQEVTELPCYTPILTSRPGSATGFTSSSDDEAGGASSASGSSSSDERIHDSDLDNRGGLVAASVLSGGQDVDTAALLATTAVRGGKRAGRPSVPAAPMTAPAFATQLVTGSVVQPPHLRDRVGELLSPRAPSIQARAHAHDVATGRVHIAPTNSNRTLVCCLLV